MSDRQVALTGIASVLLFAIGNALWATDQPDAGAPQAELLGFYADAADRIIVGATLSLLSIALFVVFASGIRRILLRAGDDDVLATAAFGGAILGAAVGLGAETINMAAALRANDGTLTADLAQSLFDVSYVLGYNAAGVGLAVFAICIAVSSIRGRALMPAWLAIAMIAVGVAMLTPLVGIALLVGLPLIVVVSFYVMRAG